MNCTVCGKPHSTDTPLTTAYGHEALCPACLAELDATVERYEARGYVQSETCTGLFFPKDVYAKMKERPPSPNTLIVFDEATPFTEEDFYALLHRSRGNHEDTRDKKL